MQYLSDTIQCYKTGLLIHPWCLQTEVLVQLWLTVVCVMREYYLHSGKAHLFFRLRRKGAFTRQTCVTVELRCRVTDVSRHKQTDSSLTAQPVINRNYPFSDKRLHRPPRKTSNPPLFLRTARSFSLALVKQKNKRSPCWLLVINVTLVLKRCQSKQPVAIRKTHGHRYIHVHACTCTQLNWAPQLRSRCQGGLWWPGWSRQTQILNKRF